MKKLFAVGAACALLSTALSVSPVRADSGETIFAVTAANALISFKSSTPGVIDDSVQITGLQTGESIKGIDFRPLNNQLFALGSTGRIYTLNLSTGAATQVGATALTLGGTNPDFGFDFNPTVDRIRVVSDFDENFRVNPDTGALAATDTTLDFDVTDVNDVQLPNVVASAYTNNAPGLSSTTLYGIDSELNILVRQGGVNGTPSPNAGQLFTVGALGVDTTDQVGFDIGTPETNRALASLTVTGETQSKLYSVDLAGGRATLIGTIGVNAIISDIAIQRAGSLELDQATYSVTENGAAIAVTVERNGGSYGPFSTGTPVATPVTVKLSTSNGTASAGSDYTATTTTLSFAQGERSKTVSIPVTDDVLGEGNENFTVTLSEESGGAILDDAASVVTILENDLTPTFPDSTPPTVLISAESAINRARFLSVGVPFEVSCSEGCSIAGSLVISAATARKAGLGSAELVIGQTTATIAGAGKGSATIAVDADAKKKLRRLQSFLVALRVVATDSQNNSVTANQAVTISVPRR